MPAKALESRANALDFGRNMLESLASYDPDTCLWRTSQLCFNGEWAEFLEIWPESGMTRNGELFPRRVSVPPTCERDYGSFPTATAYEANQVTGFRKDSNIEEGGRHSVSLTHFIQMWPTPNVAGGGNRCQLTPHQGYFLRPSGKKAHLGLDQAVRIWPTPSSNNGTGGANGLAGGSGNRQKLYDLLGKEEGKKLGCQFLNPYWVEWLMGFPMSWTVCDASATP
jgi:hypothetical protein